MEKEAWNNRYTQHATVYGNEPNVFFKAFIDNHPPGSLLLPAEGEGRNALYAAEKGWQVDAFDFSEAAKEKTMAAAKEKGVTLNYEVMDIASFKAKKKYDAVALIYVHLPEEVRSPFYQEVVNALAPGGHLVMEVFAKEQLQYNSGGPKNESWLLDETLLRNDFSQLDFLSFEQKDIELSEGFFHQGKAAVLRLVARKK